MFRGVTLLLFFVGSSLYGDEIEDIKKELAELKQDYARRVGSLEARLAQLAATQSTTIETHKDILETAVRAEVKAVETAGKLDEAQEQIRQNKAAIDRFSSTPLFDKKDPSEPTKAFEFHGYGRSGY